MNKYLTPLIVLFLVTSLANALPKGGLPIEPEDSACDSLVATFSPDTSKIDDTCSLNEPKDVKAPAQDLQNSLTRKMKQEFLQREILNAMIEPVSFTN
jgi:hypothetical protein